MKKFIIALATVIVLCVPAFADNEVYFAPVPYTFSDGGSTIEATSNGTNVYVFFRQRNGAQSLDLLGISDTNIYTLNTWINNSAINNAFGDYYVSTGFLGWSTAYFYSSWTTEPITAYFDNTVSDADIQQAFTNYLENNSPEPSVINSFTVPSGNVLYFQVTSEQDVDFDANMPRLSSPIFASQYGPWGNTGIKFGPAASLPSSGTTFPILSQDNIRWFVQAPTNVFGQSKIGTMQKHCIVGQWYALYCPDVFGLNETSADLDSNSTVPGASVKVSGTFSQIKVYPLTSTFDFSEGEFVTSSNDDYTSYFDGTIDENGTVTFTDQNGDVNSPVSGGQNFQDYETDPFALVENIKSILSNILSEIKSLFTFGYDAIQSLVNIMSDFVNVFQQLYTWLPSEVYTALVSAIIVAITIGVFKVFL